MIKFTVKDHKYTGKSGNIYTSVTTVIKEYKSFDKIKVANAYARKHPEKDAAGWIAAWEYIGKEAADYGTKVHKEEEDKLRATPSFKHGSYQIDDDTIRSLESLTELPNGDYPELLIWSNKYMIAGQVDKVTITDGSVDITDYKTYKKGVELKSFYNPKKGGWQMMKSPLHSLQDCNYNHAGIQLGLYALMLEELGYKINTLTMVHIDRDGIKTPYNVPYTKFKMFVNFMLLNFMHNNGKV